MIEEVTADSVKSLIREKLLSKESGKMVIIEHDGESNEFFLATTITFKNGKMDRKEENDLLEEDVQKLALKYADCAYMVVDEIDEYLKTFRDDTEFISDFQKICSDIVGACYGIEERDRETVKGHLAELVTLFRLSERSGYSIADMYLEEFRSNQLAETLGDEESGPQLLDSNT